MGKQKKKWCKVTKKCMNKNKDTINFNNDLLFTFFFF